MYTHILAKDILSLVLQSDHPRPLSAEYFESGPTGRGISQPHSIDAQWRELKVYPGCHDRAAGFMLCTSLPTVGLCFQMVVWIPS